MTAELLVGDVVLHDDAHTAHVTLAPRARRRPLSGRVHDRDDDAPARAHPLHRVRSAARAGTPRTVFVNKHPYESEAHGELHWGAAQLGVALGLLDGVAQGLLTPDQTRELLCVALAWVWETADDPDRLCQRNREATLQALQQAVAPIEPDALLDLIEEEGLTNLFYSTTWRR